MINIREIVSLSEVEIDLIDLARAQMGESVTLRMEKEPIGAIARVARKRAINTAVIEATTAVPVMTGIVIKQGRADLMSLHN